MLYSRVLVVKSCVLLLELSCLVLSCLVDIDIILTALVHGHSLTMTLTLILILCLSTLYVLLSLLVVVKDESLFNPYDTRTDDSLINKYIDTLKHMYSIPSSSPNNPSSNNHYNDYPISSTAIATTTIKDFNPHLDSLKKAFLTHDDFIHKVKQQFSSRNNDDGGGGGGKGKPASMSSKPASFLLSPGLLLTPSLSLSVSKSSGSAGGGGFPSVTSSGGGGGGGLTLPRPNSYAGTRRKSLNRGDSVFEGILSRVKTLESRGSSESGGGRDSEIKSTVITTTTPDHITLNINGETLLEKSKHQQQQEGNWKDGGGGGVVGLKLLAKNNKVGASKDGGSSIKGGGIGSSRSIDQILGLDAVQIKDGHVILEKVDYEAALAKSEMELCAMEDGCEIKSVLDFLAMVGAGQVVEGEGVKMANNEGGFFLLLCAPSRVFLANMGLCMCVGVEFGEVPNVLADAVKKMARKVEVAIHFADQLDKEEQEMDQQVINRQEEEEEDDDDGDGNGNESLEELNIRPPRLSLLKKKTVMNTWVSGQKSIIKKPSTFMDIMKETKEKYQTAGKLNAAARAGTINPTPRVSVADQSNGRGRINSITGLPATPRQYVDPTVYHVEKQMESWLGLLKQMHKRNGTKPSRRKGKKRGTFHDPVKIVIMLTTLGISPNLMVCFFFKDCFTTCMHAVFVLIISCLCVCRVELK